MHEDSPKMSVAQSLAASTSQPKTQIVADVPLDYEMTSADPKPPETIEIDIKIAYVDPSNGAYSYT